MSIVSGPCVAFEGVPYAGPRDVQSTADEMLGAARIHPESIYPIPHLWQ